MKASKKALRRFLLASSQLLWTKDKDKPINVNGDQIISMIKSLECVQIDSVTTVNRNHDLVLASRVKKYSSDCLPQLQEEGRLFEYVANAACLLPMDDYPIFESTRRQYREWHSADLSKNSDIVASILSRIEAEGELPASAFQSNQLVNGYWDNGAPKTKLTSHLLNLLNDVGTIHIVKRQGNTRYFDVTERAVSADLRRQAREMSNYESEKYLMEKYMRAYRIFDLSDSRFGWKSHTARRRTELIDEYIKNGVVVPLDVDGVHRKYFLLAEDAEELFKYECDDIRVSSNVITFLPPLDNLLWRRKRIIDFFDFDYKWEIYIPEKKRKYGSYTMPILEGDRFIGRIDSKIDRKNGEMIINLLELEPGVRRTKKLFSNISKAIVHFSTSNGAKRIKFNSSELEALFQDT
ncbi:hypothetical protein D3C74_132650 [compost metagenome]